MYFKRIMLEYLLFCSVFIAESSYAYDSVNKTLSRRKRYVVFPEGSSFQLVYCLTMPTYGMGQIFTMGLTAALAWELPHEPIRFGSENKTPADKRTDIQPAGGGTDVTPYRKPWSTAAWTEYARPVQHTYQTENDLPAYKDHAKYFRHYEVHRRTRRDLFEKIEKFFMAQRKDGRACLLKAICEVNQTGPAKGTFVQEILKAIFTWKVDEENLYEEDHEYNVATKHKVNCSEIYSTCSHSVWDAFL